jgi:hypothetical protein
VQKVRVKVTKENRTAQRAPVLFIFYKQVRWAQPIKINKDFH